MDFKVYDYFLDPVLIVTDDGFIQYVNQAAGRWLSLEPGEVTRGKHVDEYVHFHDTGLIATLAQLKPWDATPYLQTLFDLPKHGYQNVAKITMQCLPISPDLNLYAVIIRDKVFVQALWEEDQVRLQGMVDVVQDSPVLAGSAFALAPTAAAVTAAPAAGVFLDTENLMKSLTTELRAQLSVRAVMTVAALNVNLKCQTTIISEEWIEVLAKNPSLKSGMRCTIEIIGGAEIQPFTCTATVESYKLASSDDYVGRFKFDNLSASAKKIVTSYLEKNAIRL